MRILDVEGADGLQVGDRLIVLVCREPYENGYVINHHEGTCILGIPVSPTAEAKLSDEEELVLLDYFRGSKFDVAQLSEAQMKVWRKLDPKGVAAALVIRSEMHPVKSR